MKAARFEGTTRSRILDMQEIRTPLPRIVADAVAFVEKHTSRAAVFGAVRRVDRWPIPPEALREIVINSVIHADYSQIGGPLRLALYDDRLEVENPGLLPASAHSSSFQAMSERISLWKKPADVRRLHARRIAHPQHREIGRNAQIVRLPSAPRL